MKGLMSLFFGNNGGRKSRNSHKDLQSIFHAVDNNQLRVEFDTQGYVTDANDNFLQAMGYQWDEIAGKHHSIFVQSDEATSQAYQNFWSDLRQGIEKTADFKRTTKANHLVWLKASYTPILDHHGNVKKVIKLARDITDEMQSNLEIKSQINAIQRSLAVIEFDLTGKILHANTNFLNALGYQDAAEIIGKHHSMFVDPNEVTQQSYKDFWHQLKQGKYFTGEFKRLGKNNKEVWIQASYNPILDQSGKPIKVIKYASDITEDKLRNTDYRGQIEAISRSQAVIEFDMNGKILKANDNFLSVMGYKKEEVVGKHHQIFVDPNYSQTNEYNTFWESLRKGEYFSEEFKRLGKNNKEVWIQATYNPILNSDEKPYKVVKFATDITERKLAVNEFSQCMIDLSKGNISQRITGDYQGEFGTLKVAVNSTLERLHSMISNIQQAANDVQTGANEIQSSNLDLSSRTENQAASLEETASSMEQMTSQLNNNLNSAKDADKLSKEAEQAAISGKTVVNSTIEAMTKIQTSSSKIAEIIGTIDEIAFQTNLLALNAAVEAARAGDHGRGFSVVAAEVRSLAQRSANSAKQIRELIKDSVEKVTGGVGMVTKSGQTLEEIIEHAINLSKQVTQIVQAAEEQQSGIEQVNTAIASIDDSTQQNSALMEELSAATGSMVQQVKKMRTELAFFKM